MKPMLKPGGTKRLKLKCDIQLLTFAYKFNLRRYTTVVVQAAARDLWGSSGAAARELSLAEMSALVPSPPSPPPPPPPPSPPPSPSATPLAPPPLPPPPLLLQVVKAVAVITGYSVETFGPVQRVAFRAGIATAANVTADDVIITQVVAAAATADANAIAASSSRHRRRARAMLATTAAAAAETDTGGGAGARALLQETATAEAAGISVSYDIATSNAAAAVVAAAMTDPIALVVVGRCRLTLSDPSCSRLERSA